MARCRGLGLVFFALLVAAASATQLRVGGQRGWSVPDANAEPYNAWAGRLRFQIGDQLLFVYPEDSDSVLLVDQAAYNACNTSSYTSKFDDGNTVFTFDRSGPFFFISGSEASCRANQKLIVVVLADRSGTRTPPAPPTMPPPSSAPLPSPSTPPAAAPTMPATPPAAAPMMPPPTTAPSPGGSAPATAPAASSPPSPAAMAPSPSTPGSVPTPPPGSANAPGADGGSTTPPTPPSGNKQGGASSVATGFAASLGAYICYAMIAI